MSRTLISASFGALFFGLLLLATAARASDPASSGEVALPSEPGQTVVKWEAGEDLVLPTRATSR